MDSSSDNAVEGVANYELPTFDITDMMDENITYGREEVMSDPGAGENQEAIEEDLYSGSLSVPTKIPQSELTETTRALDLFSEGSKPIRKEKPRVPVARGRGGKMFQYRVKEKTTGADLFATDGEKDVTKENKEKPIDQGLHTVTKAMMTEKLNQAASKLGVLPPPEFSDLLYRTMMEDKEPMTDKEIRMFLLGVTAERNFSAMKTLGDMIQTLTAETSKLNRISNHLEETRGKIESDARRNIEEIKNNHQELVESLYQDVSADVTAPEPSVEISLPEFKWSRGKEVEAIGGSGTKDNDKIILVVMDDIRISVEDLPIVDTSNLPIPADPQEILASIAVALGLSDSTANDPRFQIMVRGGLTKDEKLILIHGKGDDGFSCAMYNKIKQYRLDNPSLFK
jgi:hypothetical protein